MILHIKSSENSNQFKRNYYDLYSNGTSADVKNILSKTYYRGEALPNEIFIYREKQGRSWLIPPTK